MHHNTIEKPTKLKKLKKNNKKQFLWMFMQKEGKEIGKMELHVPYRVSKRK